jgi:1-deoxy-D-xylulose-5-phosphate synthase
MSLSLLAAIDTPEQLRLLSEQELPQLAKEMREFLLLALNECGGHFAANLGTVELAIAAHYVFNTPIDRLVWDVGHQAYPHKILTGRRDQLHTIRQANGLAPFLSRDESIYDAFGVGHSSTSISAALGMAIAAKENKVVAIIGDGALTAGMAFEALNHAGHIKANLLVILNDNDMSISNNVGGLSSYLAKLLSGKFYSSMREGSKKVLSAIPSIHELAKRTEEHVKGMLIPGTLFEELGFNYIGPIDGHDLPTLISTLRNLRNLNGPQFLHVVTKKGQGYAPAEADPIGYHAVAKGFLNANPPRAARVPSQEGNSFDKVPSNGRGERSEGSVGVGKAKPTYSKIFGDWICDMAAQDPRLIGITPAMREGSDLIRFSEEYPDRYFDVAIAEQHAVTLAAGLACEGLKPVVAIYSTFLQRAYDQLIHDVALQNLPVLFAIDRGGIVGGDGPTHAGSFDLSYLRCIPNMIVMAPSDENECRQMLYTGFLQNTPCAVRYPRGTGPGITVTTQMSAIEIGKAEIRRRGVRIALLAFGSMLTPALIAGEELDATVINMRFVKPLDENLIKQLARDHELLVTIEENTIMGGAGSAVSEFLNHEKIICSILHLGLPDRFLAHGDPKKMLAECGLDAPGIVTSITSQLKDPSRARKQASTQSISERSLAVAALIPSNN